MREGETFDLYEALSEAAIFVGKAVSGACDGETCLYLRSRAFAPEIIQFADGASLHISHIHTWLMLFDTVLKKTRTEMLSASVGFMDDKPPSKAEWDREWNIVRANFVNDTKRVQSEQKALNESGGNQC